MPGAGWHITCYCGATMFASGHEYESIRASLLGRTAVERGSGFGKTIVIVNDSPELLELAEMLLGDEDFDVKVALKGAGALELIRKTLPDVVILDIRLPDVSG